MHQPSFYLLHKCAPASFYALPVDELASASLSDMVSPLIVETSGRVVPLEYGFGQTYSLGNLKEQRLSQMALEWKSSGYPDFIKLCGRVFNELTIPQKLPIMDWYAQMSEQSRTTPAAC